MSDPVVLSRRNRSFASVYGNLQRVAFEQQPPGFCRRPVVTTWRLSLPQSILRRKRRVRVLVERGPALGGLLCHLHVICLTDLTDMDWELFRARRAAR